MSEAPSVRESLQAALSGGDAPVERVETAAAVESAAPAAATSAEAVTSTPEAPASGPARDATGKFAPKTTDTPAPAGAAEAATPPADTPTIETAAPVEQEPPKEAIRVPPSLPAAVKAKFADLEPDVQQAFTKLEESVQTAKAEWGKKGERLNRFDEILGPRVDRWRLSGLDEYSGIQALLAAQDFLEHNPVEGLAHIARSYGVDLRAMAGQAIQQRPAAEGQLAPTAMPELQTYLQPLVQQVQTLQQQLQQSQQHSEHQKLTEAQATVQAFAADPANMYFENVRPVVAKLLEAGLATDLQDAYHQAIWSSREIRPLLEAEQAKGIQAAAQAKVQEKAAQSKAQTAQHAAGSITGAPAPGAVAPAGPVGSVRDTLRAAAQETGYLV